MTMIKITQHTQELDGKYMTVGLWKILFQTESVFASKSQNSETIIFNNRNQNLLRKIRK
jgi:hypothetical protein